MATWRGHSRERRHLVCHREGQFAARVLISRCTPAVAAGVSDSIVRAVCLRRDIVFPRPSRTLFSRRFFLPAIAGRSPEGRNAITRQYANISSAFSGAAGFAVEWKNGDGHGSCDSGRSQLAFRMSEDVKFLAALRDVDSGAMKDILARVAPGDDVSDFSDHTLYICAVNAWNLPRRQCGQLGTKAMKLKVFIAELSENLVLC
ncbi:hypothetical protein MTO96_025750 [Rhipicephalus appendiculatus]